MICRKPYASWLFLAGMLLFVRPATAQWAGPVYGPGSHQYLPPRASNGLPVGTAITALLAQIAVLQAQMAKISAAGIPTSFGQPYTNTTGVLAVCHFQASCRAWANGSVAGYAGAMQKARSMGFDAFSIDLGAYDGNYQQNVDNMYAACNQLRLANNGAVNDKGVGDFKLFITLDMATFTYTQAAILPVLTKYLKDPSNLIFKGKPLYSTYTGGRFGTQDNLRSFWQGINSGLASAGAAPTFIPGFETTDTACNYIPNTPGNCAAMAAYLKTFADGWWQFPSGNTPFDQASSGLPADEARTQATRAAGLYVMTGMMGQYWGAAHSVARDGTSRFYNEFYGGEGIAAYWKSVMTAQRPDIVQFCTWNDYDEGSNIDDQDVGPASSWPYLTHSAVAGYYKSKSGLVSEWMWGVQNYKTGIVPKTAYDTIVYQCRPQTAACVLTQTAGVLVDPLGPIAYVNGEAGGQSTGGTGAGLRDEAYITTRLQSSGYVTFSVGTLSSVRLAPAGESHFRVPIMAGTPSLTLSRQGAVVLTVPGLEAITAAADYANANYFTQAAHN